jgi:2-C-methyl-D-erythritol 2,4-cyclodiphosphate synthase
LQSFTSRPKFPPFNDPSSKKHGEFERRNQYLKPPIRIGYGWDSHEFKRGIRLRIGGVTLPHPKGLGGHSDGDVLLHAVTDALLGAIAAPDIGSLFTPSDSRWRGADSAVFLAEALKRVREAGYAVGNVDCTVILADPKIGPHASSIRTRVADLLRIPENCVGIKAKTPEGMGTDNAAIAHACVLLCSQPPSKHKPGITRKKN